MKHTDACKEYYQKVEAAIKEYQEAWPNYCRACGGTGGIHSYQSVPYGMGYVNMDVFDSCSACVEEGKCPRCGTYYPEGEADDFFSGDAPCPTCKLSLTSPNPCPEIDGPCECFYMTECPRCNQLKHDNEIYYPDDDSDNFILFEGPLICKECYHKGE